MGKLRRNEAGFSVVEVLLALIFVAIVTFMGVYVAHNRNNNKTATSTSNSTITAIPKTYTTQEAVTFAQKTYDDYLAALKQANSDTSNTQPAAQVGLAEVKNNLSSDLYAKAAAVTQATPFSCTAQFVTDKYTASLSSSNKTNAVIAIVISNGGGQSTDGMTATVDLTSLKITSVSCPS